MHLGNGEKHRAIQMLEEALASVLTHLFVGYQPGRVHTAQRSPHGGRY
ncbi:hypothetical protein [Pyxidicoccus caerfyrddinensis]|nr:hypothetical protein [Pyxidicoccus caerfyrddinensis]